MLSVLGRASSSNVQAVMWCIGELGLAHERRDVGRGFGGNDTPQFLAMNPNGLVPVVIDGDGPPLFESAAIVRYLAARYGDATFWPADPLHRARLDMWAEWMKTTFVPVFSGRIFGPSVFQPAARRNSADIAAAVEALKPLARMMDERIGDGPWLDGPRFTFADIVFGHLLHRYFSLDFDRAEAPRLRAYFERLQTRPAYRDHAMVSYESLRAKE